MKKTEKRKVLLLIASLGLILMLITVFLPYTTATKEHATLLKMYSKEYSIPKLNIDGKDLINISMFEYAKIYIGVKDMFKDYAQGIMYFTLVILIALFSLMALVSIRKKKLKRTVVFTVLSLITFLIQSWDYKDRGVVTNLTYKWGLGYYIFIVASVIVLLCMLIYKRNKKTSE